MLWNVSKNIKDCLNKIITVITEINIPVYINYKNKHESNGYIHYSKKIIIDNDTQIYLGESKDTKLNLFNSLKRTSIHIDSSHTPIDINEIPLDKLNLISFDIELSEQLLKTEQISKVKDRIFRDLHNDELISDCIIFAEYSNFPRRDLLTLSHTFERNYQTEPFLKYIELLKKLDNSTNPNS